MAKFVLKSDLPIKTQEKIDAITLIPAGERNTDEAGFLTSLAPYLTNEVVQYDNDDLIIKASGLTVPTGLTGFKKGALFTKTDATGNGLYMNTGDETSAAWDLVDESQTSNIPDGAVTIPKLGPNVVLPINHVVYVDGSRTDTYTANGSILTPYKTIKAAQDAINAIAADLYDSQAHFDTCQFVVNIAQGKYTDVIDISTVRYLRYNMQGVEISGAVNITQSQLGIGDYYGKVEFFGGYGSRAEKGKAGKISGDITFLKDAYDSLAYDAFIGIEVTGDVKYGATAGTGHGTWILYLQNTAFSNTAKSIVTNFDTGGHCLLIESFGFNEIKATLTGVIDLYDCNNTYFRNIDITPANGCKVKNSEFSGSVSIVASKNLQMDLNSMISMYARTPTLTGMTLLPLDGQAEITVSLSAANIAAMYGAPVTIVPAVTGKTIVIDDICLKMVRTATQFTAGGAVEFRYTNGSGAKVNADIAATVITAAAGTEYLINKSIVTSLVGVVSSPVVITNATEAFATGTGAGVLTVRYHLI